MMPLILELPQELAELLESKAAELDMDASNFVAALVREKLRLPVKVGNLEVFAPADILDSELEREPGETDEDYEANKAALEAIFRAALR